MIIPNSKNISRAYMLILALVFSSCPGFSQQDTVIRRPQVIRALSGQLDRVPVFNSNSPEVVQTDGILLSTFPGTGTEFPATHLNYAFSGNFDIFLHHINNALLNNDDRTEFLGVIVNNPGVHSVKIKILQAATYLSQPDAPFISLPNHIDNPDGKIFAGPGDRVMDDVLRGSRQSLFPKQVVIPPGKSIILLNTPIPVGNLRPPINGRTVLVRARSNGPVYLAALAKHVDTGSGAAPQLSDYLKMLHDSLLAGPREKPPSLPGSTNNVIYGRSAGVSQGAVFRAVLVDNSAKTLKIPEPGQAYSYVLSTVEQGTFGTNQVQSAPFIVRYKDTAYAAHGNYGVEYKLYLPLYNPNKTKEAVTVSIQTPIKSNQVANCLLLKPSVSGPAFFRGTVKIREQKRVRYIHLVQKQGQEGEPLIVLQLKPKTVKKVKIDFLYPPDSTPPQVLTIKTQPNNGNVK